MVVLDQHIKIPPNSKTGSEGSWIFVWACLYCPPKHRFFYSAGLSYLWLYKNRADKLRLLTCSSALHLMRLALWWRLFVNSLHQSMFPVYILGSKEDSFSKLCPLWFCFGFCFRKEDIIAILSASSYNLPFKIKYIYLLSFCDKLQ